MPTESYREITIDLTCHHCGHVTSRGLHWLKENDESPCPRCNSITYLNRDDLFCGFRRAAAAMAQVRDRLSRFSDAR